MDEDLEYNVRGINSCSNFLQLPPTRRNCELQLAENLAGSLPKSCGLNSGSLLARAVGMTRFLYIFPGPVFPILVHSKWYVLSIVYLNEKFVLYIAG